MQFVPTRPRDGPVSVAESESFWTNRCQTLESADGALSDYVGAGARRRRGRTDPAGHAAAAVPAAGDAPRARTGGVREGGLLRGVRLGPRPGRSGAQQRPPAD